MRNIPEILAVDFDLAGNHVIEPKQQSADGRLARAGRAHDRNCFSRWNGQAEVLQDRTFGVVTETDVVECYRSAFHFQLLGSRLVRNLVRLAEEVEQIAHIDQRLPDFPIDRAEEIQRNRQLHHVGIDEHEVPDRDFAFLHADGSEKHRGNHARRDQERLAQIQRRQ